MRHLILAAMIMVPVAAAGQEQPWRAMSGAEIDAALSERTLRYTTATQKFYASGRTLYDAGRPSWGYWRVEGDQYCSQWPPSDLWACYGMARSGDKLRFIGAQGDTTDGVYFEAE